MDIQTVDIDKLEAGRELDELIAIRVLGFEKHEGWDENSAGQRVDDTHFVRFDDNDVVVEYQAWELPHYSTDIAAALSVIDHLFVLFPDWAKWNYWRLDRDIDGWEAGFTMGSDADCITDIFRYNISASAPTAPLAICRAALKAVTHSTSTPAG